MGLSEHSLNRLSRRESMGCWVAHTMIMFQFYIYHIQMIVLLNQVNWSEINRQETKQGCWVCVVFFTGIDFVSVSLIFLLDFGKDHTCGANREDSYHFFFDCSHYANMRYKLFHNLSWLPNDCAIDLRLLTSGNPILSNEQNEIIFKHVFDTTLFDRACMHMNISNINMCKLKKNRE
jgi:hypothetical protein